jgi:WD40 repeat protein
MEDNTFLVGTEGGAVYKCNISQPSDNDVSQLLSAGSQCRWKREAIDVMANLPTKSLAGIKKAVERYVMDKGEKDIWAPTIFSAKPDIKVLFSIPFKDTYEKHMGPVTGTSCSPFVKRIFLTCSTDGTVRMYDVLGKRPILTFEPGYNEYLTAVAWSPFRPTVFVTVSDNGTLYIYDLMLSK